MATYPPQYSVVYTLFKGGLGVLGGAAYSGLLLWAYNGFSTNDWTVTPEAAASIAALATAIHMMAKNWWNNGPKLKIPGIG